MIQNHLVRETWQDWKYTSFMIFICDSQNIGRHSAMGGD